MTREEYKELEYYINEEQDDQEVCEQCLEDICNCSEDESLNGFGWQG